MNTLSSACDNVIYLLTNTLSFLELKFIGEMTF